MSHITRHQGFKSLAREFHKPKSFEDARGPVVEIERPDPEPEPEPHHGLCCRVGGEGEEEDTRTLEEVLADIEEAHEE